MRNFANMKQKISAPWTAHLSLLAAAAFFGIMAPLGKDAMNNGIDGITLVTFRVIGGALLFGFSGLFVKTEKVPLADKLRFAGAALLGLVCNQCCYTIGLSLTSPINAGIVTTTMPIFALIMSALILKEPITTQKALGVFMGCCGALILIAISVSNGGSSKVGNIQGDLLCLASQLSYTLYLTTFNPLVKRYSVFTVNRWMFLWASLLLLPFTAPHVLSTNFQAISLKTYLEVGYVVCFGTFICYLLMIKGQRVLRPTVVSMYNYMQPVMAVLVSVSLGLAIFTSFHFLAIAFIFAGVWLVIRSKSKRDIEENKA